MGDLRHMPMLFRRPAYSCHLQKLLQHPKHDSPWGKSSMQAVSAAEPNPVQVMQAGAWAQQLGKPESMRSMIWHSGSESQLATVSPSPLPS